MVNRVCSEGLIELLHASSVPYLSLRPRTINGRRRILLVIYFTNLLTPVHSSHVATVPLLIDVRAPVLCLAEANTDKKIQLPATDHFGGFSDAKQFFKHSWLSGAVHNVIPHHCARLLGLPKTTIVSNASVDALSAFFAPSYGRIGIYRDRGAG